MCPCTITPQTRVHQRQWLCTVISNLFHSQRQILHPATPIRPGYKFQTTYFLTAQTGTPTDLMGRSAHTSRVEYDF